MTRWINEKDLHFIVLGFIIFPKAKLLQ